MLVSLFGFFLSKRQLFDEGLLWDQLNDYGSQYALDGEFELNYEYFYSGETVCPGRKPCLRNLNLEARTQNCQVSKSYNPQTKTICLSVFFDDVSQSELGFKKKKLSKFPRRPVRQLHFLIFYRWTNGGSAVQACTLS